MVVILGLIASNASVDLSAGKHLSNAARGKKLSVNGEKLREYVGRLLCWLGVHDFRVVDVTFGFGEGGSVERVECRRCGLVTTHQA